MPDIEERHGRIWMEGTTADLTPIEAHTKTWRELVGLAGNNFAALRWELGDDTGPVIQIAIATLREQRMLIGDLEITIKQMRKPPIYNTAIMGPKFPTVSEQRK